MLRLDLGAKLNLFILVVVYNYLSFKAWVMYASETQVLLSRDMALLKSWQRKIPLEEKFL